MEYKLTDRSDNVFIVKKLSRTFYLLPNSFSYQKWYPDEEYTYKKVVNINFYWLKYSFTILLRKPRKL